jgi:hypothetical protein
METLAGKTGPQRGAEKDGGKGQPRGKAPGALAGLALALAALSFLPGCRAGGGAGLDDPALSALGRASARIMAERMNGAGLPWPSGEIAALAKPFAFGGTFEGPASDAALAISKALGYGLAVKNAQAGAITVTVGPSGQGRSVLWLIGDLNRQLKKNRASIGVDAINRRLILSGPEGR